MKQPPKVALVHDHLVQDGGAERVLRTLMKLWPEAPVYTALYDPAKMGPDFHGRDIRTSWLQKLPGATRYYKALLPLLDGAFRRFDMSEYELVVSSASGFAKSVRTGSATHVCYCHTPIRYLWSDSERYVRELPYPAVVKAVIKAITPRLRRADLRGARGVDAYVANSSYVAERIRRYYDRPSIVIYPPVNIDQFTSSPNTQDYFLIATRLEPYKRVDLAIEVFNSFGWPLTVMGNGTDRTRLEKLAGPTITFAGRVSDTERQQLFAEAQALINPQEEDFGITTVEALASGTPVIAYGRGGAAEILEDGVTGVLFAEQTQDSLAASVQSFDRQRFDPSLLLKRAKTFSEVHFMSELSEFVTKATTKSGS